MTRDRGLMWRVSGKNEAVLPSELADYIMRLFLDLLDRANQGRVERPHIREGLGRLGGPDAYSLPVPTPPRPVRSGSEHRPALASC